MYILGISAFYHDSAACLIKDDEIIAAAQEERFTRKKHDANFPHFSILYCLKEAQINANDIENIVFYEKPFIKFERLLETYLAFAPKGFTSFRRAMPLWIKDKLFQKSKIIKELRLTLGVKYNWNNKLLFSEHHLSHAASAYYPSPFNNAVILTIDGVGEWATTSLAIGKENRIIPIKEMQFPHSLGLLYSAFTQYLGFKVNSGEYKIMGLAPYGEPRFSQIIEEKLISIKEDGSFQLNMNYFDFATGLTMTNKKFENLFKGPARSPETKLTQREMDIAASIQKITQKIVISIAKNISKETGEKNLCLAGGVALNCVVNGIIQKEKIFDNIWIQPASGDAGGALGGALLVWYQHYQNKRKIQKKLDNMKGSYLGPKFSNPEIETELFNCNAVYQKLSDEDLLSNVVSALTKSKAVGWFQGRMEFGPRALGARSIIADPRSPDMQKKLNLKIKYRESFRPFAPSILCEDLSEWFDLNSYSPYMLLVADINKNKRLPISSKDKDLFGINKLNIPRSLTPAITHVDYSARIQTVHPETNDRYYKLISKFKEVTGCPILVNTSFNIRGEPIICTPTDAFNCFMGTELDVLVIENYFLVKEKQKVIFKKSYQNQYELD